MTNRISGNAYTRLTQRAWKLSCIFPVSMTVLLITGLSASLLEGLTMAALVPLLERGDIGAGTASSLSINIFATFFRDLNLEQAVRLVAFLLFAITVVKGILYYLNNVILAYLQVRVVTMFRRRCFEQLLRLGSGYLNRNKTADLFTLTTDYTKWMGSLVSVVGPSIPRLFTVAVLLTMLLAVSWKLTLPALLLIIGSSLVLKKAIRQAELSNKSSNEALMRLNHVLLSVLNGMKVVRAFSKEKLVMADLEKRTNEQATASYSNAKANSLIQPIFESFSIASLACILLFATYILQPMETYLPSLLAFILILFRLLIPVVSLNQTRAQIAGLLPMYSGLESFLKTNDKPYVISGKKKYNGLKNSIKFENVQFGYETSDPLVLKNISFTLEKGSKTAIVGSSGAGKSTITELLLRFYDPGKGRILIDGIDLRDLDIESWRSRLGIVTQDTFLFNDTIAANIAFGDRTVGDDDRIIDVAKIANAHDFIMEMPDKYETVLGDRGIRLSGGQRQRLAIARALYHDPELLILDEATSSLDGGSERLVQSALERAGKGRTTVTIAHRLSTIENADLVIVLAGGRVSQCGRHQELANVDGLYKNMLLNQGKTTIEPHC